ncbi:uncharacterized protein [Callorhinus ursinus]|uniref:uncharacterized protein isoform X2 n=1 Tax=Callorhinus ursinus TaxID=34884 RepID=UPI003CD014AD
MKDRLLLNYHSFVGKTHFKLPAFFCPLIPSKQQFPEAMTCPCSWRPSREGHRGLLGPVLPTEEGSMFAFALDPDSNPGSQIAYIWSSMDRGEVTLVAERLDILNLPARQFPMRDSRIRSHFLQ